MRARFLRQLLGPFFLELCAALSLRATEPLPPEALGPLQSATQQARILASKPASREEWAKVDRAFRELASRFPKDANIRNAHAAILWERGETSQAKQLWHAAEALDGKNSTALYRLGSAAIVAGDTRGAAGYLEKACAAEPANPLFHFDLANVLILFRHDLVDSRHPDPATFAGRALEHYAEACRLAPQSVDYARGYAETFYGIDRPDWHLALKAWQHLHDISPVPDFALANLATIHLKLGQKDEALTCVAKMQSPGFAARKASLLRRIETEEARPAPAAN